MSAPGNLYQWMAKGAFEFLDPTNRKGWGLGVIEHALVDLWKQLSNPERIALDAHYQKAISIYKRLPPVLALWAKEKVPVVLKDDGRELTKEEMDHHVDKFRAHFLKDTWEIDACFSRWAERSNFISDHSVSNHPAKTIDVGHLECYEQFSLFEEGKYVGSFNPKGHGIVLLQSRPWCTPDEMPGLFKGENEQLDI